MPFTPAPDDRRLGPHTWLLTGNRQGTYPDGNSILVEGGDSTALLDASLTVHARPELAGVVDVVVLGHVHEDHVAGLHHFADRPVLAPTLDLVGLQDLDGLLSMYGYPPGSLPDFERSLVEDFHYAARPDAQGYDDGDVGDLGGGVTVRAIHLPGHTRGHSGLLVEPDGVLYLGDIDLTGFGPYYGDAWSDLEDFERSLARCRDLEAAVYATFHHKGAVEGREAFLPLLDAFAAVVGRREEALLAYLAQPRTLDELVAHRFVYRPTVDLPFVDAVERRSTSQHLDRLAAGGRVTATGDGRFVAA